MAPGIIRALGQAYFATRLSRVSSTRQVDYLQMHIFENRPGDAPDP
jgi:hypothetical protein